MKFFGYLLFFITVQMKAFALMDCPKCKKGDRAASFGLMGVKIDQNSPFIESFEPIITFLPLYNESQYFDITNAIKIIYGPPIDVLIGPRIEYYPFKINSSFAILAENTISLSTILLNKAPLENKLGILLPIPSKGMFAMLELSVFKRWNINLLNYFDGSFYDETFGIFIGFKSSSLFP